MRRLSPAELLPATHFAVLAQEARCGLEMYRGKRDVGWRCVAGSEMWVVSHLHDHREPPTSALPREKVEVGGQAAMAGEK